MARLPFLLLLAAAPAMAAAADEGGTALLRPSQDRAAPARGSVLGDVGAALRHMGANALPMATLRGSSFHVVVPDGGSLPPEQTGAVDGTVALALRGSLETRRAAAAAHAAKAGRHAAALAFLPRVDAVATLGDRPNTTRPLAGIARERSSSLGLEATVPIFTSGVLLNTLHQARALHRAAELNFLQVERKAALDAALAHVDLRLQRRIVEAVDQHARALRRVATVAKALFRAGEVSRTDVAIARANAEAVAADRADARRRLRDAEAEFASLTGTAAPDALHLPAGEETLSLSSAVERAVAASHALGAQRLGADALRHAALAERGRWGPQVSGYLNAERDLHHSTRTPDPMAYEVGVRLRVPLLAAGAAASVDKARAEAIEARYSALDAERRLRRQIAALWHAERAADERRGAFRRQMAHIDTTVRGTLKEYRAGFRSITDVLEAQVKHLEATVALETAVHRKASATLRLRAATGRLDGGTRR